MKLIDYVLKHNKKDIKNKKEMAEHYNIPLEKYIIENYCPYYFESLKDTRFNKPTKPRKEDNMDCKYNSSVQDYESYCLQCWNREINLQ